MSTVRLISLIPVRIGEARLGFGLGVDRHAVPDETLHLFWRSTRQLHTERDAGVMTNDHRTIDF